MITFSEDGIKSSYKIILNSRGIIIKEKGFLSSSYKEVFAKKYSDVWEIKLINKVVTYSLTFNDDKTENFNDEDDANKVKKLVELGKKNLVAIRQLIGDDDVEKSLDDIDLNSLEEILDKNKFGATTSSVVSSVNVGQDDYYSDKEDDDDDCQYRYDGTTMVFKKNQYQVDDNQKDDFPTDAQVIVFPSSWKDLYEDDFPNGFPQLRVLDFTRAYKLKSISDGCFHDCDNLNVVVLPPNITSMPCFKDCDNLIEIHAPRSLDSLYAVTEDGDNRITAYLSNPDLSFDEEFCNDCKQVFVPRSLVKEWREEAEEAGIDVQISPLPEGYSFPKTPLSKPWTKEEKKPELRQASASPAAAPCPPPMPTFSFHAFIEGKQGGPYDREQFKRLVDAGMVTTKTLVWTNGMSGWEKAGEVEDLEEFFPKSSQMMPPPVPGCPPVPPTI